MRSDNFVSIPQTSKRRWASYLSNFQTIVNCVLEGSKHNFSHQFRLDHRFSEHKWHEVAEVRKDEIGLVVSGRVESCHGKAADFHI